MNYSPCPLSKNKLSSLGKPEINCNTYLLLWLSSLHYFCLEGLMSYYSNKKNKKTGCSRLSKKLITHTHTHTQCTMSIIYLREYVINIVNTFHHYFNSITAHVEASETREKTKLKRNHSLWTGLTLIDMTPIIRQYSWSKLPSPLWRYTICSNLSYDKNKLWLQPYSTANNSIFHKMTTAANKTTYRYFRYYLTTITLDSRTQRVFAVEPQMFI